MPVSLSDKPAARHRLSLENVRPAMAKAHLKNLETEDWRERVGRCIVQARSTVGWTQDQLAGEIARAMGRDRFDAAQVARWEAGKERPYFDVLLSIAPLRWPLTKHLAALDDENEIVEEIRRRSA